MMLRIAYVLFGLAVVAAAMMADSRGWLGARTAIVRDVPRSIRDNPGAYRALYTGSPRLFGGK